MRLLIISPLALGTMLKQMSISCSSKYCFKISKIINHYSEDVSRSIPVGDGRPYTYRDRNKLILVGTFS